MYKATIFFLYLLFSSTIGLYGQNKLEGESEKSLNKYTLSTDEALDLYKRQDFNSYAYLHGRDYKMAYHIGGKNPYLNSTICSGTIFIDGHEFADLFIIYDILNDYLVVKTEKIEERASYVHIEESKVDSCIIKTNDGVLKFVHRDILNASGRLLASGYCEEVYKNNFELYFKHHVLGNASGTEFSFELSYDIFLLANGDCYKINTKESLLKVFPVYKKEIRKKIASLNKRYKNMTRAEQKELIAFIEVLNHKSTFE